MSIIIRNVTSISLHVKKVEHFGKAESKRKRGIAAYVVSFISFIINAIASLFKGSSAAKHQKLSHDSNPSDAHDKDVQIDAFKTTTTDIDAPGPKQTVRLLFEVDGQQYQVDLPGVRNHSVKLTPLNGHKHELTAIYSREHAHLAVFSTGQLNSWMRSLKDETPLTGLSMPGTHNSPTCHRALPSVRCQAASPRQQMENGVRFFDIRVQVEKPEDPDHNGLILVHSVFPISLTGSKHFRELLDEILDFLRKNPSETMVISLKREGTGAGTDQQFAQVLRRFYAKDELQWYTKPQVPTLGEARGKIVLLRRFHIPDELRKGHNGQGWGINAETWADNTPHALTPDKTLCVQDFYEVLKTGNIDEKAKYCIAQLERAAATVTPLPGMQAKSIPDYEKQPLFINFLSASNFWKQGCWPEKIAAKVNPAVVDYLCRKHNQPGASEHIGDGTTGIVVCDWVGNDGDWDLVRCIVGHNARLKQREQEH